MSLLIICEASSILRYRTGSPMIRAAFLTSRKVSCNLWIHLTMIPSCTSVKPVISAKGCNRQQSDSEMSYLLKCHWQAVIPDRVKSKQNHTLKALSHSLLFCIHSYFKNLWIKKRSVNTYRTMSPLKQPQSWPWAHQSVNTYRTTSSFKHKFHQLPLTKPQAHSNTTSLS